MNLDQLQVTTTAGEVFTGAESALLAHLINKRFGYDTALAATKWRNLLQNNTPDHIFAELAEVGRSMDPTRAL